MNRTFVWLVMVKLLSGSPEVPLALAGENSLAVGESPAETSSAGVVALEAERLAVADQLVKLCREAREKFRPITPADLRRRRQELLDAVDRLDARLRRPGENGSFWRQLLLWQDLRTELARPEPDLAVLKGVLERYTSGREGLRKAWFLDVRDALGRYIEAIAAFTSENIVDEYQHLLDELVKHLPAYLAQPSNEQAIRIGEAVRWLEDAQQAPELVKAVRQHLVRPNLFVEVSAELAEALVGGPVDTVGPVRDCILGTDVHACARTVGQAQSRLLPSECAGVLEVVFRGKADSRTVGYHGPVTAHGTATASLEARKRIWMTAAGMATAPAVAKAGVDSQVNAICTRRGSRIVERMAWRRSDRQKPLADAIASQNAAARLAARIDQETAQQIRENNRQYEKKFRQPLVEHKMFPSLFQFTSTAESLRLVGLQAGAAQLGALTPPPPPPARGDIILRLHESAFNNALASALGGMIIQSESFRTAVTEWAGKRPEQFDKAEDEEPLAIGFTPEEPITASFADNGVVICVRGDSYWENDRLAPGGAMYVTVRYKFEPAAEGFKAVRQGPLEIYPPGFIPGGPRKLNPRQIGLRTMLERRFGKLFEQEIALKGFDLPERRTDGKRGSPGRLVPVGITAEAGWLSIAWQRVLPQPQEKVAGFDGANHCEVK